MLQDFKYCILILTFISFSASILGQPADSIDYQYKIDSLHETIIKEFDRDILLIKNQFSTQIQEKDERINSLNIEVDELKNLLGIQGEKLDHLRQLNDETSELLRKTRDQLEKEKYRFNRILLVSIPSILFLLMISTILYFVFLMRYQSGTQTRISSLEESTRNQIVEGTDKIHNQMKKRFQKYRSKLKKEIKKIRKFS